MKHIRTKDIYIISQYLGIIMQGIGISVLIPLIVVLFYRETVHLSFIVPGIISFAIGTILHKISSTHSSTHSIRLKHGMMISSFAWIWASFIGALVMMSAVDMSFINAFFENMSAWTGTGFTLFPDLNVVPKSVILLRSIEQWIGGLGVVTLIIGLLLHSGRPTARLYKSEAREEKISPSIGSTLKKIIKVYVGVTIIGIIIYILAGMPIFDSVNNTLMMVATGGMSPHNEGMGFYHDNIFNIISIILMIIGGTSFLALYKSLKTKGVKLVRDVQFQAMMFLIIAISLILIFATDILPMNIIYHVVSAVTTTGSTLISKNDVASWPGFVKSNIMILMLIGGASGSTAGAIKLIRIMIVLKGIGMNIKQIMAPEGMVHKIKLSKQVIKENEIKTMSSFIVLYMLFVFAGWFVLTFYGYDPMNALFDVISAQGNVGINTGVISASMPFEAKIMIIVNMWVGRLEIIPILVVARGLFEVLKGIIPSQKPY
ncbi:TrkH family potassium uptake protein [Methanobrevibacter filiformis]|uniref:Trk system potassium uptake protein TrkG n=1 Tax=Methanobrevibacter filiformis TaxID=55758 RepID=A0A162FC04_9EURY|nr:TrkH family potassium uptake protein [Methanobrevibacter filiformis]KZX10785.1 Trk system potassium uptake protein TrkG [Methanobrevibacter filiformis]